MQVKLLASMVSFVYLLAIYLNMFTVKLRIQVVDSILFMFLMGRKDLSLIQMEWGLA